MTNWNPHSQATEPLRSKNGILGACKMIATLALCVWSGEVVEMQGSVGGGFSGVDASGQKLCIEGTDMVARPCSTPGAPKPSSVPVSRGQMTDPRDESIYKTVSIGSQTWMAQNLNYRTDSSWCYDNNPANCTKYGRLYHWRSARMACPDGWHLSSDVEWSQLEQAIGGAAGKKLKSTTWDGSDVVGLNARPAGRRNIDRSFNHVGSNAGFWTSSEYDAGGAWYRYLYSGNDDLYRNNNDKTLGFSVRCLLGEPVQGREPMTLAVAPLPVAGAKTTAPKVKPKPAAVSGCRGQMTDPRDKAIYKTVTIGSQTWMVQNLKFRTDSSWCYGNKPTNCTKYGRLYNWPSARIACPAGWHLPSNEEWGQLEQEIGGAAGKQLKSTSWDGSDVVGFGVLPAGSRYDGGSFSYVGSNANFWSSSEDGADYAWSRYLYSDGDGLDRHNNGKKYGFSVRCLED